MSFSILYKRLFQVQILHGFYLNRADRLVDFNPLNNPSFQLENLLEILPTASTRHWLRGHRARLLPEPYGFNVALRVAEKPNNGILEHYPQVPVEIGTELVFGLKPKQEDWLNFSNQRLQPNVPAIHFFSNLDVFGDLTAPFLARPLPVYNNKRAYEMGELAQTNQAVYMAKRRIDSKKNPTGVGGIHWERLFVFNQHLPHQFCSTEDQLLLPPEFSYRFTPLANESVKKGSIVLRALDNTEVKSIAFDEPHPIDRLLLDFKDIPTGFYTLEVSADSGYEHQLKVHLNDELYDPALFGVIQIGHQDGLGDFRLLENDQSLRRNEDDLSEAPIFKLLIKNRHTYWHYVLNQDDAPNPAGNADVEYLDPASKKVLITKKPVPLSRSLAQIYFQHDKPATEVDETLLLPNPDNLLVHRDELGRYYSEIYLSKIKT